MLGRNISFLVPVAIRSRRDGYIAANRATGVNRIVGHSREVKIERKDGSEIWGSLSMSRVEVNGEITYMGFVRDVTEEVKRWVKLSRWLSWSTRRNALSTLRVATPGSAM